MPITKRHAKLGVGAGLVVWPDPATTALGLALIGHELLPKGNGENYGV